MADPIIVKIGTDPEQDRDYTDWNAFAADLDNPALYSSGDEVIAEAYNDGPFILNDNLVFSQGESIGLASVTLTVAPGHRHNGTAGTGVVIDGGGFDLNKTWFHAEWLEVQNASSYGVNVTHGSGNVASRLSYLLCHHIGGDTKSDRRILAGASHQGAFHMTRCILYNLWQGGGGSRLAIGVSQGGTRQNYVRNVTIHYIRTTGTGRTSGMFGADRNTMVWENIVCTDVLDVNGDPAPCFALEPLAGARVWRYLASQDATAADADEGGIINIDPSTLYVNADPDAADLAIVDDGSGVATGGANLYGVINGVELAFTSTGEMRDLNAEDDEYWSIGAFQFVVSGDIVPTLLTPGKGSLMVVGSGAVVSRGRVVDVGSGKVLLAGISLIVLKIRTLQPDKSTVPIVGKTVGTVRTYVIAPATSAVLLAGSAAEVIRGRVIHPLTTAITAVGKQTAVLFARVVAVANGTVAVRGKPVSMPKISTALKFVSNLPQVIVENLVINLVKK